VPVILEKEFSLKMVRQFLSIVMLLLCSAPAFSQDTNHDGLATILVPISFSTTAPIEDAYASKWKLEVWFHNGSAQSIRTLQPGNGNCMPSCETTLYAR
jgi:hypothetical protein